MSSSKDMQLDDELTLAYKADEERYKNSNYGGPYQEYSESQLIGHMMLAAHSLEKGLSSDVFELGHGFGRLVELADMVDIYATRQYDIENVAYVNALSILDNHVELYRGTEYETAIHDMFANITPNLKSLSSKNKILAGVKKVNRKSKQANDTKNFEELVDGRSSARAFSEEPIDKKDLKDAIRLAQKSPSACNRQAVKIYEMHDPEIIKEVMFIQEGFSYQNPPQCLTLIVADDHNFSGAGERNQGYIDGGLFAMSFMYALEFKKLAACPLHASFTHDKEQLFRKLLNIPDNEKLIVFIAIGQFKDEYTVAKSYRYPVEYVSKEITQIDRTALVNPEETTQAQVSADSWLGESVATLRRKMRIRTRIRSIQAARKEGKLFYALYKKLAIVTRSKKKKVYIFGAPFHSNLGDQAQTYCMEMWYTKHFPEYTVVSLDTLSAFQMDQYLIRKIRDTIRPDDKIVLHSGYHTTDLWDMENRLNVTVIDTFPEFDITVFPQTIHFENLDNLKQTAAVFNKHGKVTLMCRDEKSFETAKEYFTKTELKLMPDVVTSLIGTADAEKMFIVGERDGILMCFRNDKESKHGKDVDSMKFQLRDISNVINQADTTIEEDAFYLGTHRREILSTFFSMVARHKLVITDRYHGTIFSVITNTPVVVLGSTDHKLSSGVKWFSDKVFSNVIHYAESPEEAVALAKKLYDKYDFTKKIPPVFNEKYWDKVDNVHKGMVK